ncbi:hypothetical protein ElyMa_002392100 [Elysia marginata]|uniref:Uncharacterized protein n=1 Tax=Elysia marginata TaxID=1093978 RepID=A0AAV4GFN1_9GAST|nr:hypothetical protein ElyMa_002392100 [Elysia marginata]
MVVIGSMTCSRWMTNNGVGIGSKQQDLAGALRAWVPMTMYGLPPRDERRYHDLASAGHIILTPTQPVGARTVLGCVSNPRPPGHGSRPLPTELSRPRS